MNNFAYLVEPVWLQAVFVFGLVLIAFGFFLYATREADRAIYVVSVGVGWLAVHKFVLLMYAVFGAA